MPGKGDRYRPVDPVKWSENYDRIFRKPKSTAGPWARCLLCGDRFRSEYRHDYHTCKCGKSFIDGGSAYVRASVTTVVEEDQSD